MPTHAPSAWHGRAPRPLQNTDRSIPTHLLVPRLLLAVQPQVVRVHRHAQRAFHVLLPDNVLVQALVNFARRQHAKRIRGPAAARLAAAAQQASPPAAGARRLWVRSVDSAWVSPAAKRNNPLLAHIFNQSKSNARGGRRRRQAGLLPASRTTHVPVDGSADCGATWLLLGRSDAPSAGSTPAAALEVKSRAEDAASLAHAVTTASQSGTTGAAACRMHWDGIR